MLYSKMIQAAQSRVQQYIQSGAIVRPMDTVCVIYTTSGRIYSGMSHTGMMRGQISIIHAEIEAVQNMLAFNEKKIQVIMLLSAYTGKPMLPCTECIKYIASLNPENTNCHIMLNESSVPIADLASPNGVQYAVKPTFAMNAKQKLPN